MDTLKLRSITRYTWKPLAAVLSALALLITGWIMFKDSFSAPTAPEADRAAAAAQPGDHNKKFPAIALVYNATRNTIDQTKDENPSVATAKAMANCKSDNAEDICTRINTTMAGAPLCLAYARADSTSHAFVTAIRTPTEIDRMAASRNDCLMKADADMVNDPACKIQNVRYACNDDGLLQQAQEWTAEQFRVSAELNRKFIRARAPQTQAAPRTSENPPSATLPVVTQPAPPVATFAPLHMVEYLKGLPAITAKFASAVDEAPFFSGPSPANAPTGKVERGSCVAILDAANPQSPQYARVVAFDRAGNKAEGYTLNVLLKPDALLTKEACTARLIQIGTP